MLPAAFVLFDVGGPGAIFQGVAEHKPEFLNFGWDGGMQFAIMIILAVSAAEMLNQTLWQRIYTARDHKVIRKSLLSSAVMVFPMTIVAASTRPMASFPISVTARLKGWTTTPRASSPAARRSTMRAVEPCIET